MAISRQVLIAAPAFILAFAAAPAHARPVPDGRRPDPIVALDEAQHLAATGEVKAALGLYKAAVTDIVAAGEYPAAALRGVADLQYALGNTAAAASALDDLASNAEQFGDPATQITALLDAAFLHQALGNRGAVAEHERSIRRLLKSPVLTNDVRASVEGSLAKK